MNEKKLNLIDKGLSLMSEKGYYSTSIQEIASAAGISKGAFYLYFQSKEDFVVTSIEYIYAKVDDRLKEYAQLQKNPKETFVGQIGIIVEYINRYKWFIFMYMNENFSIGDRMDALINKIEETHSNWLQKTVTDLYKEQVDAIHIDVMIQLEGLLSSYCKWLLLYNIDIDYEQMGHFIARRLDDLVNGMRSSDEHPLITTEHLNASKNPKQINVERLLETMKNKITSLPVADKKRDQLKEVVHTLEAKELDMDWNPIVLQGLLAHFNPYPVLHSECQNLADLWNIELL